MTIDFVRRPVQGLPFINLEGRDPSSALEAIVRNMGIIGATEIHINSLRSDFPVKAITDLGLRLITFEKGIALDRARLMKKGVQVGDIINLPITQELLDLEKEALKKGK